MGWNSLGAMQFIDGWPDILRVVNLFLAGVVLIWLVVRRVSRKDLYRNQLRNDIWLMATYWTASNLIGTFEQLFDTGTNIRVILYTFALLVTARILLRYDEDWYAIRGQRLKKRGWRRP